MAQDWVSHKLHQPWPGRRRRRGAGSQTGRVGRLVKWNHGRRNGRVARAVPGPNRRGSMTVLCKQLNQPCPARRRRGAGWQPGRGRLPPHGRSGSIGPASEQNGDNGPQARTPIPNSSNGVVTNTPSMASLPPTSLDISSLSIIDSTLGDELFCPGRRPWAAGRGVRAWGPGVFLFRCVE